MRVHVGRKYVLTRGKKGHGQIKYGARMREHSGKKLRSSARNARRNTYLALQTQLCSVHSVNIYLYCESKERANARQRPSRTERMNQGLRTNEGVRRRLLQKYMLRNYTNKSHGKQRNDYDK